MSDQARRKIAVINDDPAFLQLVNDVLEAEGRYDVYRFQDEETSLAELRALLPDLIIIDILLAELPSGWELALLAGADQQLGPVPIVVSSSDVPGSGVASASCERSPTSASSPSHSRSTRCERSFLRSFQVHRLTTRRHSHGGATNGHWG